MWTYGALSQNQQSFATKAKFYEDCGSLAPRDKGQVNQLPKTIEWLLESPQSNPQNMSGDFGARRSRRRPEASRGGAEGFRGLLQPLL